MFVDFFAGLPVATENMRAVPLAMWHVHPVPYRFYCLKYLRKSGLPGTGIEGSFQEIPALLELQY